MTASPIVSIGDNEVSATPKLNILLAMCFLVHRSGAELFTRDIALWLRRRGHSVTVFANTFGEMVDELRHESIACIADLSLLASRPDVIIGNTHHETVRAILHFPDVPALSISHDRSNPHGRPPLLSQVRRFIAVDANCAERLSHEHGIAADRISVIPNGVDLQRFKRRAAAPERLRRALVFSSYAQNDALLGEIRATCNASGIQLDVIGSGVNNLVREPENLLGEYDLVFAKGRAATEALAVGCACILLDHSQKSMGFLVAPENMEHARNWNFGRALLIHPITSTRLQAEIAHYEPNHATAVTDWVRSHAGLDSTGDALEQLAQKLVRSEPVIAVAPAQQIAELQRYISAWIQANHPTGEHVLIARLRDELSQLHEAFNERQHAQALALQTHEERVRNDAQSLLAGMQTQAQQLTERNHSLQDRLTSSSTEISQLHLAAAQAQTSIGALETQRLEWIEKNRSLHSELSASTDEISRLRATVADLHRAAFEQHERDAEAIRQGLARVQALTTTQRFSEQVRQAEAAAHASALSEHRQCEKLLQDRVQALLTSASWRITAPLRWIFSALQKLVG